LNEEHDVGTADDGHDDDGGHDHDHDDDTEDDAASCRTTTTSTTPSLSSSSPQHSLQDEYAPREPQSASRDQRHIVRFYGSTSDDDDEQRVETPPNRNRNRTNSIRDLTNHVCASISRLTY